MRNLNKKKTKKKRYYDIINDKKALKSMFNFCYLLSIYLFIYIYIYIYINECLSVCTL